MAFPRGYTFSTMAKCTVILVLSIMAYSAIFGQLNNSPRTTVRVNRGNISAGNNAGVGESDNMAMQQAQSVTYTETVKLKNNKAKGTTAKPQGNKKKEIKGTTDVSAKFKKDIEKYLKGHSERCQKEWSYRTLPEGAKPLCDCVPNTLVGYKKISTLTAPLNLTLVENPEVRPGGHWAPRSCTPRSRLVVIVPFRGRAYHLSVLLKYLHPILQGQQLNYTIVVVEQHLPDNFNKAALMNIGYVYARDALNADCVVFHDVDLIPEDGRHFYTCREKPIHLGAYHSRHKYGIMYGGIFGAVTAFKPQTFELLNGFSNRFFGWGGEDDDMYSRVRENKKDIIRDPRAVAGYTVLMHKRDKGNVQKNRSGMLRKLWGDRDSRHDGLTTLRYLVHKRRLYPLYTWLLVDVLNDETKMGMDIN